jgi:DNA-binding response OmpR family regulator
MARVIYVEDDQPTLEAVATMLRERFDVRTARTGEEALLVAAEIGYSADVLVVDLDLGRAMSGEAFIHEYRRRAGRSAPAIVVSAGVRAQHVAMSIGAARLLAKPFDLERLVEMILQLVPPPDGDGARGV